MPTKSTPRVSSSGIKLRPPDNTGNFKIARFGNRDQTSRNLGIGCIQYDPISGLQLHKSVQEKNGRCWIDVQHRGRLRIDGWRNNEKTAGRSKDFLGPGKGAKRNRNPVPYLDVGDAWPNRLDDSGPSPPMTEGSCGFNKYTPFANRRSL